MRRNLALFLSLVLMLGLFTAPAYSELRVRSQSLAPAFGMMFWDMTDKGFPVKSKSPYLGARYTAYLIERFGIQVNFGIMPSANAEDTKDYMLMMLGGDAVVNLATETVVPYVLAGAGFMRNLKEKEDLPVSDPYFELGGGIKFFVGETVWLGVDARDVFLRYEVEGSGKELLQNILGTVEVGFQWGGGPPPDTDMDGVSDKKDNCPDTPTGALVDLHGCPIDGDGDGVYDGLDKCAGTPAGATVDKTGCPKDSDADGVLDGVDKCAGTPKGAVIDKTGCPKDSDGDGIFDGLDKCPDTRAGAKIDATGCEIEALEYEFLSKEKVELHINFKTGSAIIMDDSKPELNNIGAILTKYSEVKVEIAGHTDAQGSDESNMKLSQKRAESVRLYLVENFKMVGSDRLIAKGYGESQPVASNDTKEGMAQNRRVEVKVLNPEALKQALPPKK
jgi:OOP family OmpA-OmpF porin